MCIGPDSLDPDASFEVMTVRQEFSPAVNGHQTQESRCRSLDSPRRGQMGLL